MAIAIVTGASRRIGIGAAICRELAAAGHDVLFTHLQSYDREFPWGADEEGPAALERELTAMGIRAVGLKVDLSTPEAPEWLIAETVRRLGVPAILVNNATHSTNEDWSNLTTASLDAHYAVNLRATAMLSVAFARTWTGGPGGRIISLTSGQSQGPMPGELAYAATKGAIEAFTLSLSAGVAHLGITVNAVDPGPTDTGWMTPELKEALLPKFPMGRIGTPQDAARLVAFLASDAAGWVTGQIIHSEGGFLRQ